MAAPLPELADKRLFKQLESLFVSSERPNEFLLLRLQQQAEQLSRADLSSGLIAQAGIAALNWDTEKTLALVQRAVSYDSDVAIISNAALTLKNLNLLDHASDLMMKVAEGYQGNDLVVGRAVFYLLYAGRFAEAIRLGKSVSQMDEAIADAVAKAISCDQGIRRIGIEEERVRRELRHAYQVLSNHKVRPVNIGLYTDVDPDGTEAFVVELEVFGDFDMEMRLEAELAQLLGGEDDWNPCELSIEVKCMQDDNANIPA